MTWVLFEEKECPKCHSNNIVIMDDLDWGAIIVLHMPMGGADYKCKDCEHEWSNKLL